MIYRKTTFAKMHDDRRLLAYRRACITTRMGIQFARRIRLLSRQATASNTAFFGFQHEMISVGSRSLARSGLGDDWVTGALGKPIV